MADSIVEVIRFTSSGVPEIVAQTKALSREAAETSKRYTTLQGLLTSPAYQKHAAWTERMAKSQELINQKLRNQSLAARLADGSAARQLRTSQLLNRQYAEMQRRLEFSARYGERLGGFMSRYGGALAAGGHAIGFGAAAVAGAGLGFARSGFEGTVEQAKFDTETKRLSRELAGVMKPVMDLMTRGAKAVRTQLERLGPGGQNLLMGGMLLGGTAGTALALRGAMRMAGLAGTGLGGSGAAGLAANAAGGAAGATGGMSRRGALRAGAGLAGAGLVGYGAYSGSVLSGLAGGALLGGSVGGPWGAAIGAGLGAGTAALSAAAQNAPARRIGETGGAYWARRRGEGRSWLGASKDAAGDLVNTLGREADRAMGNGADRRKVQLAGGGFESMDAAYERVQSAIEKVEGVKELTAAMRELINEMRRARGEPPLPRPGG